MRRRGHTINQDASKNQATPEKELSDVTFTTKYIDTLNDLQRLEDENKRLMIRMRSLEVSNKPLRHSLYLTLNVAGSNSPCIEE